MVAQWLQDYVYGAIIGILFLFLVGAMVTFGTGSGITGYATAEMRDRTEMTGNTKEFKIISFACELTPAEIHVNQGDFVLLRFTSYDLSKTKYLFELPDYDINLVARDKQVSSAKFFADRRGIYKYYVNVPCQRYGFETEGKLYVH